MTGKELNSVKWSPDLNCWIYKSEMKLKLQDLVEISGIQNEKDCFIGLVTKINEYPTIWVKSLDTGKSHKISTQNINEIL